MKLRGAMLKRKIWISALFFLATTEAFVVVRHQQHPSSPLHRRRLQQQQQQPTKLSCICIDCARVTNCAAYHFVETKHEQPHMNENPTFEPVNGSPTIHVNVSTIRNQKDRQAEAARMWREYKEEEVASAATDGHGQTVYDFSPVTTTEYDVVACESFVEDKGAWVRNMPEEIRQANPNFVPT